MPTTRVVTRPDIVDVYEEQQVALSTYDTMADRLCPVLRRSDFGYLLMGCRSLGDRRERVDHINAGHMSFQHLQVW